MIPSPVRPLHRAVRPIARDGLPGTLWDNIRVAPFEEAHGAPDMLNPVLVS